MSSELSTTAFGPSRRICSGRAVTPVSRQAASTGDGADHLEFYLTQLAVSRRVSAGTQNQALSALLFLYKDVLKIELPWLDGIVRARRPQRLPVVMSAPAVAQLLAALPSVARWIDRSRLWQ